MNVPGFRGIPPRVVVWQALKDFVDDDMFTYAAALTFHVFFALFPFILFLIALLGFLRLPGFFEWLLVQARLFLPAEALVAVETVIREVRTKSGGGVMSLGILVSIWAASAGIRSTMNALNVAYHVKEGRALWKIYLVSLAYTVGLAVMVVAAVGLMLLGEGAIRWVAGHLGLRETTIALWSWLRVPAAVMILMLAISLVYYVAPNVKQDFRYVTPGAVLAVLLWAGVSVAFGYYVSNFADYGATYGSIGTVIVLMLYIYVTALAFLLGGEVNSVIEEHVPEAEGPKEPAPQG